MNLFSSFTPVTKDDWIRAASVEIQGKNPNETLQWTRHALTGLPYYDKLDSINGVQIDSFRLAPGSNSFRGARDWYNLPIVNALHAKNANESALIQLTNGADGILFDVQKNPSVSLQMLLSGIEWPHCNVSFLLEEDVEMFFKNLSSYLSESKVQPELLNGFFLQKSYPQHPQLLHNVIHTLSDYKNLFLLGITSQFENPVDQLSDLLIKSVRLIDALTTSGTGANLALRNIFFSVSVGTDFFIEIAKLKALRILWFQVVRAYGIESYNVSDVMIHAHSISWNNNSFEPHENMLKSTTASMAAILGGCTALSTEPDTEGDERLTRIARNVSNVMREESHLDKVADPTAGSYYLENLVYSIAHEAWAKFRLNVAEA